MQGRVRRNGTHLEVVGPSDLEVGRSRIPPELGVYGVTLLLMGYALPAGPAPPGKTRWHSQLHLRHTKAQIVLLSPHQCCCRPTTAVVIAPPLLLLPHHCCCCPTSAVQLPHNLCYRLLTSEGACCPRQGLMQKNQASCMHYMRCGSTPLCRLLILHMLGLLGSMADVHAFV